VEVRILVSVSGLSSAELTEVFSGFGDDVGSEFKGDATGFFSPDFHIEEDSKEKRNKKRKK
jgi:hypothetical protein